MSARSTIGFGNPYRFNTPHTFRAGQVAARSRVLVGDDV